MVDTEFPSRFGRHAPQPEPIHVRVLIPNRKTTTDFLPCETCGKRTRGGAGMMRKFQCFTCFNTPPQEAVPNG
jgi:hypothetical protein